MKAWDATVSGGRVGTTTLGLRVSTVREETTKPHVLPPPLVKRSWLLAQAA
jgi:hypothetical protein